MTFTKTRRGAETASQPSSPPLPGGKEAAALRKRRCELISQLATLADEIRLIDKRLSYLMEIDNEEAKRAGEGSEAQAEAATESRKAHGEA